MLFAFLSSAALSVCFCMRPSVDIGTSASIASVSEKISAAARKDPRDSVELIQAAADMVNTVMLKSGNASEYLSDTEREMLVDVVEMIRTSIYASLSASHNADSDAVGSAVEAIDQCNKKIDDRLKPGGDLAELYSKAERFQRSLTSAQGEVTTKTQQNNSAFAALENHIKNIRPAPGCEPFPSPATKGSVDVFFETSLYVDWFKRASDAYAPFRQEFERADESLYTALTAYAVALAQRNVEYCDWKAELEDGCNRFDECYQRQTTEYSSLSQQLEEDMRARIDAYKACETIISQINYLLGNSGDKEPPTNIDTGLYTLLFPDVPEKGLCSLIPLESDQWIPRVECDVEVLLVESFEGIANGQLCEYGEQCHAPAWVNPSHPSYIRVLKEDESWSTPFGEQAIEVFGFRRCPGEQHCGLETGPATLTEPITPGYTYEVSVRVAAAPDRKKRANYIPSGDYQVELAAFDDNGSKRVKDWTRTTLAFESGTTASTDFTTEVTVRYHAVLGDEHEGERLAVRLLDRDEEDGTKTNWKNIPMFDQIVVTRRKD